MPNVRCQRKTSRWSVCGGHVAHSTDGMGRVVASCERCARRAAGVCRDCPCRVAGTVGRATRCATCKKLAAHASTDRYKQAHRKQVLARARTYARAHQTERIAYNRLWRRARPEKKKQYQRDQRARYPEQVRQYYRTYYHAHKGAVAAPTPRLCMDGCGVPVDGRTKRCPACRRVLRSAARQALAERMTRERAA
jgi:hypothetical protein